MNKTIESLNHALSERTEEINSHQKYLHEMENCYLQQETKLRQDHEKLIISIKHEYEDKLKSLEKKYQKYEISTNEFKNTHITISRLEDELLEWKKNYSQLEKMKQKEIVIEKEVYRPAVKEKVHKVEKFEVDNTKIERRLMEEKHVLQEEINSLKQYISDLEIRTQQSQQNIYIKEQELQRTYVTIEELQYNLKDITIEVERVKEENITIIKDREKMLKTFKLFNYFYSFFHS